MAGSAQIGENQMQNNFADPYAGLPNHGDVPPLPNGEIDLGPEAEAQLAKGQNPPDSVSGYADSAAVVRGAPYAASCVGLSTPKEEAPAITNGHRVNIAMVSTGVDANVPSTKRLAYLVMLARGVARAGVSRRK